LHRLLGDEAAIDGHQKPVTNDDASEHSYSIASTISSGLPSDPSDRGDRCAASLIDAFDGALAILDV
jgi:hypothetical protein